MGLASALDTLDSLLAGSKDTIATGEQIRQSILSRRIPSRILEPIMANGRRLTDSGSSLAKA